MIQEVLIKGSLIEKTLDFSASNFEHGLFPDDAPVEQIVNHGVKNTEIIQPGHSDVITKFTGCRT